MSKMTKFLEQVSLALGRSPGRSWVIAVADRLLKKEAGAVKCLHCGDVIVSTYRHDYKWCSCHSIMVDGGTDYFRFRHAENARYLSINELRDLEATLVGDRDISDDKEWCHYCKKQILESKMTVIEVEIPLFSSVEKRQRYICKENCRLTVPA